MTRQVGIEPEAEAALGEAALWYENHRTGLGSDFLGRVDLALSRLNRWPRAGVAALICLLATDVIRILAVAHDRSGRRAQAALRSSSHRIASSISAAVRP